MPTSKGMCLSRELESLFFKKLKVEKHLSPSTLPGHRQHLFLQASDTLQ